MSENCNHDCSNCANKCSEGKSASFAVALNPYSKVRKVVAVASGKGGVGKSLVTTLLAVAAAKRGKRVAILDADITGPSVPAAFGLGGATMQDERGILPTVTRKLGIQVISLNLLVENPADPVVWRGPVIAGAVKQFWSDVVWDDVDVMFVDMPPGTGDVPLTVFQSLPVDGVVVVTTPQQLVGLIVGKSLRMAAMMKKRVYGLVENMSVFKCPDCGREHAVFGESRLDGVAAANGVEEVARLPIDPKWAAAVDAGTAEDLDCPALDKLVDGIFARAE